MVAILLVKRLQAGPSEEHMQLHFHPCQLRREDGSPAWKEKVSIALCKSVYVDNGEKLRRTFKEFKQILPGFGPLRDDAPCLA